MYTYAGLERRRTIPRFVVLSMFAIGIFLVIIFLYQRSSSAVISPLPDEPAKSQSILSRVTTKKRDPEELRLKIQQIVNSRWVNYSVLVEDYSSEFSMGLGETVIFTAASVNKLPILTALYDQVQKGEIDLDRVVTLQQKDIQDYGTGSIRYDTPGSTYSIKTLAKLMIQQSDNTAAFILLNHIVGMDTVQEIMNTWGLTQTDMEMNKTSNRDISLLLERLYTRKVANEAYTLEMLAFMKDTDFEDRIPALLPKTATVYHKIGNEVGVFHDTGIVEEGSLKYYIGILTTDVSKEEEAIQISAEISKAVYDYMK